MCENNAYEVFDQVRHPVFVLFSYLPVGTFLMPSIAQLLIYMHAPPATMTTLNTSAQADCSRNAATSLTSMLPQ